jgi:hypothetical protein
LAAGRGIVDAQGAIDDGVFGVQAQVDEGHPAILRSGIGAWLAVARAQPGLDGLPTKDSWSDHPALRPAEGEDQARDHPHEHARGCA